MLRKTIFILAIFAAAAALAAPDSSRCRMIDWLDAPSNHDFFHYGITSGWPIEYCYSGNDNWDLAMGDSFMVWLPGTDRILFLDSYDSTDVNTIANFDYGSVDAVGVTISDSVIYLVGGMGAGLSIFRNDSLIVLDGIMTPMADYHFAALEDSFLYTWTPGDLTCINVADPEDIFIYRTYSPAGANSGLTARDGFVFYGGAYTYSTDSPARAWPRFKMTQIDMINSATPLYMGTTTQENRFFGDLATDGNYIFAVNTEMSDGPAWTIGESDMRVWGAGDVSYNFDSRWDGQGVFGVDVIDTHLIAAGFGNGFSLLNISNLDSIYEVAYYIDEDSTMDITHFAMKETRIYAMAHPRDGYARLYMFELDDSIVLGIDEEPSPPKPSATELSAYPNPFNSAVRISLDAPVGAGLRPARVEIFDIAGRRVAQLPSPSIPLPEGEGGNSFSLWEKVSEGRMRAEFTWQPDAPLGSGVYLVRARVDGESVSKRIVYLK